MARRRRWAETLLGEIASQPRVLIALDFDRTLVPANARPASARLNASERSTLSRLIRGRARVAVISGRSVANLRDAIGVTGVFYGGVFGLEIEGPGWHFVHPKARAQRRALAGLAAGLGRLFAGTPGVQGENKGVGVCVHYRGVAPERRRDFDRRLERARAAAPDGFLWLRGRSAWEVLPRTKWDKGAAAKLLWRRLDRPYLFAVGDDRFDEPMLRVARERGAGARVGCGASGTARRLRDHRAVLRFLRSLAARIESRGGR